MRRPPFFTAALTALLLAGGPRAQAQEHASGFAPRDLGYVLQAEALGEDRQDAVRALATCDRDLIVLDSSYTGDPNDAWTPAELKTIHRGKRGRTLLAYLSIGEAEDYRAYWRRAWDRDRDGRPDAKAPDFLAPVNPDWEGNYKVRYWQAAWQELILARVDRILAQGFDGLYLDIVDAFEHFEQEGRINPETRRSYRADMVAWVARVAARARERRPGALIVPQNGAQLVTERGYLNMVSGLAVEDTFTDGDERQDPDHTREVLNLVAKVRRAKKPVLAVEYPAKASLRGLAERGAKEHGMVLLITDRALKTLGR